MGKNPSIIPRLRRFQRNAAATLDKEGERFSEVGHRTSQKLRRLGRSLAASLDSSADYMEDDPIGAFLESENRESGQLPDTVIETLPMADIPTPPPVADTQIPDTENLPPPMTDILASPPAADTQVPDAENLPPPTADILTPPPAADTQIPDAENPPPPMTDIQTPPIAADTQIPDAGNPPPPMADILPPPPVADTQIPDAGNPPQGPGEESPMTAMPTSEIIALEVDGQDLDMKNMPSLDSVPPILDEPLPTADFSTEMPPAKEEDIPAIAPDEEMGFATTVNSETLSLDIDSQNGNTEGLTLDDDSQEGSTGDGDSLLDIFRSEDVEENPLADLAKGLSNVNINDLLEKARQVATDLKGEP